MAALNIGVEYLTEQTARREEAAKREEAAQAAEKNQKTETGHQKRGRELAKAAKAYRQGVSYTGTSVTKPFTSQNTSFMVLSGRRGPRREKQGYRQWMRHGGGLCGWRGRYVRVLLIVCPGRLPAVA